MPVGPRSLAVAAGAALLASLAVAGPATADPDYFVSFHTGAGQSGTEYAVDIDAVGECVNLPQAAKSALNISPVNVDVFFRPNCETGSPDRPSDLHHGLGSLHSAEFPYPAVSHRVLR